MEIFSYNPDEVNVLVAGFVPISGFVDGTFVEVVKDIVPFNSRRTADGTVSRLYNNDATYTITLRLHSGSPSNDVLTKLWQIDEITQTGKFPILIKDQSGTDLFFSTTSWIEILPGMIKSTSVDERVWVLRSSQGYVNFGNNQEVSGLIQDIVNIATSALPTLGGVL